MVIISYISHNFIYIYKPAWSRSQQNKNWPTSWKVQLDTKTTITNNICYNSYIIFLSHPFYSIKACLDSEILSEIKR